MGAAAVAAATAASIACLSKNNRPSNESKGVWEKEPPEPDANEIRQNKINDARIARQKMLDEANLTNHNKML